MHKRFSVLVSIAVLFGATAVWIVPGFVAHAVAAHQAKTEVTIAPVYRLAQWQNNLADVLLTELDIDTAGNSVQAATVTIELPLNKKFNVRNIRLVASNGTVLATTDHVQHSSLRSRIVFKNFRLPAGNQRYALRADGRNTDWPDLARKMLWRPVSLTINFVGRDAVTRDRVRASTRVNVLEYLREY